MQVKWTVSNLDRKVETGYVYQAHWQATAVDGEHSASVYATCSWSEGQPVTPYESLTEAAVLAWVWQSVDKEATEAAVAAQIAEQKAPKVAAGLPW